MITSQPSDRNPYRHFLGYARDRDRASFTRLIDAWKKVAKECGGGETRTRSWLGEVASAVLLLRECPDLDGDVELNHAITLAQFAKRINRTMRERGCSARHAHREALAITKNVLATAPNRTVQKLRDYCAWHFERECNKLKKRGRGRPCRSLLGSLCIDAERLTTSLRTLGNPHSANNYARLQKESPTDLSRCIASLDDVIDDAARLRDVLIGIDTPAGGDDDKPCHLGGYRPGPRRHPRR